ncbi:acetoin reductase [Seiridium cupressi]
MNSSARLVSKAIRPAALRGRIPKPNPALGFSSYQGLRAAAPQREPNEGKSVIVTGASRGIGKSIALRLAADGYNVCINDIGANSKGCEEIVNEIKALGRQACSAIADVTKRDEVVGMNQTSVKELGPLNTIGLITETRIANAVNIFGVQNCYAEAAKQMISQGNCTPRRPGKIIGAASIVAFKPFALLSHYSASKWAVRGLTQAYAMEVAEHNITVNAYAPGIVGTAMWELIDSELAKKKGTPKGSMIEKYVTELTALGRVSVPENVANHVSFLASSDSDFVTGQTQIVDGGIIYT